MTATLLPDVNRLDPSVDQRLRSANLSGVSGGSARTKKPMAGSIHPPPAVVFRTRNVVASLAKRRGPYEEGL
jgi:hypothetical protein